MSSTPNPSIFQGLQKVTLETLPDEFLLSIVKAFEVDVLDIDMLEESVKLRTALSKLALCSKKFNKLTTPALYSTLVQTSTEVLPGFIKGMLDRPERQQYVKQIVASSLRGRKNKHEMFYTQEL